MDSLRTNGAQGVHERLTELAVELRQELMSGLPRWLLAPVHGCIVDLEAAAMGDPVERELVGLIAHAQTLVDVCRASRTIGTAG